MSRISLKKYRVSIHALLAECDRPCQDVIHLPGCFNPRTPCGVRPRYFMDSVKIGLFQSTHSLRSATAAPKKGKKEKTFQSTHSLRSATNGQWRHQGDRPVSIHALLAECDWQTRRSLSGLTRFQSTHSLRSATPEDKTLEYKYNVSIHALLAECDRVRYDGKRRLQAVSIHALLAECDNGQWRHQGDRPVSIHALLAECDGTTRKNRTSSKRFNPRTPCGVRPFDCAVFRGAEQRFQSTHSLRSATAVVGMKKS